MEPAWKRRDVSCGSSSSSSALTKEGNHVPTRLRLYHFAPQQAFLHRQTPLRNKSVRGLLRARQYQVTFGTPRGPRRDCPSPGADQQCASTIGVLLPTALPERRPPGPESSIYASSNAGSSHFQVCQRGVVSMTNYHIAAQHHLFLASSWRANRKICIILVEPNAFTCFGQQYNLSSTLFGVY